MSINASLFFIYFSYLFAYAYSLDFFIRYKAAYGTKPTLFQYIAFVGGYRGKYFLLGLILIFLWALISILYRVSFLDESMHISRKSITDFVFVFIISAAYGIYLVLFKKD